MPDELTTTAEERERWKRESRLIYMVRFQPSIVLRLIAHVERLEAAITTHKADVWGDGMPDKLKHTPTTLEERDQLQARYRFDDSRPAGTILRLILDCDRLDAALGELQAIFDLQRDADQRAVKRWQQSHGYLTDHPELFEPKKEGGE